MTLPEVVTSIGKCAFFGCTKLKSVILPKILTELGCYTFEKCAGLGTIEVLSNLFAIRY